MRRVNEAAYSAQTRPSSDTEQLLKHEPNTLYEAMKLPAFI